MTAPPAATAAFRDSVGQQPGQVIDWERLDQALDAAFEAVQPLSGGKPATFAEAIGTDAEPAGNPALAAATEAIIRRRLSVSHHSGDETAARTAILVDALPDATAALEAAAPHITPAPATPARELERELETRQAALIAAHNERERISHLAYSEASSGRHGPVTARAFRDFARSLLTADPEGITT